MRIATFFLPLSISALTAGFVACGSGATAVDPGPVDSGTTDSGTKDSGPAATYAVGGTITGIAGTGLILDNGGDSVTIAKTDKTFTFSKKLAKGAAYSVKIKTQPDGPAQTCTVTAGDGTIAAADVTSVAIACTTNQYPITVTVKGLEGGGLVLQNNAGDDLTVAAANPVADVKSSFTTKIDSGKAFAVTIKTQPTKPNQICTVAGGTGNVVSGEVSSIVVNCTDTYTIGGTVAGLAGNGLVLQNNAGDDVAVNANGTFAFAKTAIKGDAYAVTVKTQPTDPWQTCAATVGTDAGTVASADITSVAIVCTTNKYTISGTITGLTGTGAVLQNNGGDNLTLAANDTKFAFPIKVDSGANTTVTVKTQPGTPTQTCALTNAGPTKVAGADITNVALACTTNTYKVAVKVTGLTGTVVFQDNGGDDLSVNANGATNFVTAVASGKPYVVTIKTQSTSAGEICSLVAPTSGTITNADVAVTVVCSKNKKVFVSSALYDGNLGGLAGADAKCQGLADAAALGGTYKAWLSDNTANVSARLTQSAQPYVLVDGTQIWANWTAIVNSSGLAVALGKTEKNTAPPQGSGSTGAMWTNSNSQGTQYGNGWGNCNNFTSNSNAVTAVHGNFTSTNGGNWTAYYGANCNQTAPLVCFQQ